MLELQPNQHQSCQALLDAAQGVLPEGGVFVLLPYLKIGQGKITLSLKAGEGRLSYLKDLPAFIQAREEGIPYPVSKSFIFSPAWMRLSPAEERLMRLLRAHLDTREALGQPLRGGQKRDVPLSGSLLPLVLEALVKMPFIVVWEGEENRQEGIEEMPLPLLFRLDYDLRGVLLSYSWQAKVQKLEPDHRFALLGGNIVRLSREDSILLSILPVLPVEEEGTYRFSRGQTPRVFSDLLPWLSRGQTVILGESLQERLLKYPLKFRIYLDREGRGISARVVFAYGDIEVDPFGANELLPAYLFRDAATERQVMDLLARYGFRARSGRADLQDDELIFEFLMSGVAELHRMGQVFLSDGFRQLTPRAPALRGHIRLKAGRVGLELADDGQMSDEIIPLLKALAKRKKYFRYKNGAFITLHDAQEWQALAEAYLENAPEVRDQRDLPAMRAHYLAALIEKDNLPVSFDEGARTAVNLNPTTLESPVEGLFDYQLRGFRWIAALHMLGLGGILADEMGLGKTVQMIAAIQYFVNAEPEKLPSLIISPTTLLYNWQTEIERFAPGLQTAVVSGSKSLREKALDQAVMNQADVIITSYPLLRQDISLYESIRFRFAVLDEAQNIKNFTSQTARAAKRLNAHTRLALTGTPMENNVAELWSLFDYVLPGYLFSAREFLRRYEDGKRAEELRLRIRPFLMRRLKTEVMAQLPEKLATILYCEMNPEQRRVYRAALLKSRAWVQDLLKEKGINASRIEVLSAITLLRQICCHPRLSLPEYTGESAKLELLMEVLPEVLAEGRRVLLFSQFTSMLRIIRERLDQTGIPSLYLDGETDSQERLALVERFNEGQEPVFLISLKAGGTGLNLTGADMVIHYDPWWNPTAEDQANDRAHRLGQDKPVQIIHLLTRGSIEEAVVEMGHRKRRLFDKLITPGEAIPHTLSQEDVLKLFEK